MPSERPDRAKHELGRLAARLGPEFDHLFERMAAHLQRIDDVAGDRAEVQDELADGRDLIARGRALLEQLAAFSGQRNLAPERHDLRDLVSAWWPRLQRVIGPANPLELRLRGTPIVELDAAAFALALENLCINAREASPPGALLELLVSVDAAASEVVVELVDHGCGMSAEVSARAREPLFTTKPRHTGLGLAAAAAVVEAHGGRLTLDSALDTGTTIHVRLPLARSALPSMIELPIRVLLIASERLVVRWMQRSLTSKGCEVRVANDVLTARELLPHDWPELLIVDRILPDGDARNFALELARERPERPLLFGSSRAQLRRDHDRGATPLPGHVQVLDKPYSTRRFDTTLNATLAELRARRG